MSTLLKYTTDNKQQIKYEEAHKQTADIYTKFKKINDTPIYKREKIRLTIDGGMYSIP